MFYTHMTRLRVAFNIMTKKTPCRQGRITSNRLSSKLIEDLILVLGDFVLHSVARRRIQPLLMLDMPYCSLESRDFSRLCDRAFNDKTSTPTLQSLGRTQMYLRDGHFLLHNFGPPPNVNNKF